jgi:hypothetical protein
MKIAYRTNNTIQDNLTPNIRNHDKFWAIGIYKLIFPDSSKAYIGQTSWNFSKRYNEHIRVFRNNRHSSKFAQHFNEHMHNFGSIQNILQILCYQKKGPHLNTIERFYIHKEAANDNQLNDKQTIFPNKIFDAFLNIGT